MRVFLSIAAQSSGANASERLSLFRSHKLAGQMVADRKQLQVVLVQNSLFFAVVQIFGGFKSSRWSPQQANSSRRGKTGHDFCQFFQRKSAHCPVNIVTGRAIIVNLLTVERSLSVHYFLNAVHFCSLLRSSSVARIASPANRHKQWENPEQADRAFDSASWP